MGGGFFMQIDAKAILDTTVTGAKGALTKAGSVAKDLGEKSVLKVEQVQLQRRLARAYENLGVCVADFFAGEDADAALDRRDNRTAGLLLEIDQLRRDIDSRAAQLAL
jgi:hypothetical protein